MKEIFFGTNAVAALAGWVAFTVIMLSAHKDENEKTFNLKSYALEYWDNWLASLVSIPVLLWVGFKQLNLGVVDIGATDWNDLFYLGSGFVPELVKTAWKKVKSKTA
jgi:hypothetical protein